MSAYCPICKGMLVLLGILGRMEHVYCRNCGIESSREIDVLLQEDV